MPSYPFPGLNPIAFLQSFVIQSMESDDCLAHDGQEKRVTRIERQGLDAGNCFEAAYRQEFSQIRSGRSGVLRRYDWPHQKQNRG